MLYNLSNRASHLIKLQDSYYLLMDSLIALFLNRRQWCVDKKIYVYRTTVLIWTRNSPLCRYFGNDEFIGHVDGLGNY